MPNPWDYNSVVGGAGTAPGYTGPYDPGSAMNQWWGGVVNAPFDYNQAGFDPNNPFGTTMVNPNTGETFAITPEMEIDNRWGMTNQWDEALANHGWVAPGSYKGIEINGQEFVGRNPDGSLNFNFGGFDSMFGSAIGGRGAPQKVSGYDFTNYPAFKEYDAEGNQIATVDPYAVSDFSQSIVDTNAVINAALPGIYEQQDIAFANAANRAGQSGMAMSTPYAQALGDVSRRTSNDIASLTEQYRYNASEALAERRMQEELQQRALEEAAWEAQNQMNIMAQQANQQAAFQAWMAENQYGQNQWLNQNQLGMEDYWNQQDYGLTQQQMAQQQQLAQQQAQAELAAQMMGQIMGQLPQGMP